MSGAPFRHKSGHSSEDNRLRILIVEDDDLLADGLSSALDKPGYAVDRVSTGDKADAALQQEDYDLIVLDIGLPKMDGFEVLRRLRRRERYVAVLILTARDSVDDRVHGLDLGADDYLVKPFALSEFEARVRALLRRGQVKSTPQLIHAGLTMDTVGHRVWVKGEPLNLTAREWTILEYLLSRPGKVVSKDKIVQAVYNWNEEISLNAIEVHISRLRSKIEPGGVIIRTIRGFGYLLEEPVDGQ